MGKPIIHFKPKFVGQLGLEQEAFVVLEGDVVAESPRLLSACSERGIEGLTYELSAAQVEFVTPPCVTPDLLIGSLMDTRAQVTAVAEELGLSLRYSSVGPEDMPLDVYPNERYHAIRDSFTEEELRMACRVAGVHVHYGCANMAHAIDVCNALAKHWETFHSVDDLDAVLRLRLYTTLVDDWKPRTFEDEQDFWTYAFQKGFALNLSDCWLLVRITKHGTVEVRIFANSEDPGVLNGYARQVVQVASRVVYTVAV